MDALTFLLGTGPPPRRTAAPHPPGRETAGASCLVTGGVHFAGPARWDLGSDLR